MQTVIISAVVLSSFVVAYRIEKGALEGLFRIMDAPIKKLLPGKDNRL